MIGLGALLVNFVERGVRLSTNDGVIRFSPRSALTGSEVAALRLHKTELLLLFNRAPTPHEERAVWDGLTSAERAEIAAEAIAGDRFACTTLALVVAFAVSAPIAWLLHSHRLDRELWLLSDVTAMALVEADRDLPCMLADELPVLREMNDGMLRRVLDAKEVFGTGTHIIATGAPSA